ncbi:MAG: NADH-quinone oxidoreductase subunit A [Candidatus Eiseniibacteriota bacterium]|jgi:NADH-quinone oxidoreductase subunit A
MDDYRPVALLILMSAAFAAGTLFVASLLSRNRPRPAKRTTYECGVPPVGDARERVPVRFYLVAMLFIVFDIEATFLIPWAVVFRQLQIFGLVEMCVFIGMLVLGYIYIWRRGAFDWNR